MNLSLFILFLPPLAGYWLVRPIAKDLLSRFALGAVVGYVFFTALGAFAWAVTGSTLVALFATVIASGLFILFSLKAAVPAKMVLPTRSEWIFFGLVALLLQPVVSALLYRCQNGGLCTSVLAAYGDIPWHVANITAFAEGQSFPPENPSFAGQTLIYPFLSSFYSSLMSVGGASLEFSLVAIARVLIPVLAILIFLTTRAVGGTRRAGFWAAALFLLAGSTVGFLSLPELKAASGLDWGEYLLKLPGRDVTGVGGGKTGVEFVSAVLSFLLAQRNLLFAMPLWLAVVYLLLPKAPQKKALIIAGLCSGLLPLFHAHAFLALLPVLIALAIGRPRKQIQYFCVAALPTVIPCLGYFALFSSTPSYIAFRPGFMTREFNPLVYWLQNLGLLIPAAIWAATLAKANARRILCAALFLLLAANVIQFAQWHWDNYKIALFGILLSLIGTLAVLVETKAWHRGLFLLAALHGVSGAFDLYRVSTPWAGQYTEWTRSTIAAADVIREKTPPRARILAAPVPNHTIALTGRIAYLGFPPHVWSWGGDPWKREAQVASFYRGLKTDLEDPKPQFVFYGPQEVHFAKGELALPSVKPFLTSGEQSLFEMVDGVVKASQ